MNAKWCWLVLLPVSVGCGASPEDFGESGSEDLAAVGQNVIANDFCSVRAYAPTVVDGDSAVHMMMYGECDPNRSANVTLRLQKYTGGKWQTLMSTTETIRGPGQYYRIGFQLGSPVGGTYRAQVLAFGQTDSSKAVQL